MTARADKKDEPAKGEDFGQSEIQHSVDEAQKVGYFGSKVDPMPNSAHSLESGPDSPTVQETREAMTGV